MSFCVKPSYNLLAYLEGTSHVLVLFTMLTVLFITYIHPMVEKQVNEEVTDALRSQLTPDAIKKWDPSGNFKKVLKSSNNASNTKLLSGVVPDLLDSLITEYSIPDQGMTLTNKYLYIIAGILIAAVLLLFISSFSLSKFACNKCTNIWQLVFELLFVFSFVGMVEFGFFTKVAKKYIPVVPSTLVSEVIKNLKVAFPTK